MLRLLAQIARVPRTEVATLLANIYGLVATYCPILMDYTTDEAVLAGLLNNYRLVVHRLSLSAVRNYQLTFKSGSQFTTSERENY